MEQNNKTLIELWQDTYPKLRPWIVLILVLFLLTSVIFDSSSYKIAVIYALGSNIIFLIFDFSKTIKQRLDKIDANLIQQTPKSYTDFNDALPDIKNILSERLNSYKTVKIRILAVSAQFSWRSLIESTIPKLLKPKEKHLKIDVDMLLVNPALLKDWGQKKLKNDAESTLLGEENFKKKFKQDFTEGSISIRIQQYDNIPHWHGILIDNDVLFMGRCKWEIIDGHYHLLVGQVDYRQFRLKDKFGGAERIDLFENWFDAYNFRISKKKTLENENRNNE